MKQKILTMILLVGITASMLTGCGQMENVSATNNQTAESLEQPEATEIEEATEALEEITEPTEEPHTHNYTETITTEASCETVGLKTFTCECGDTYTEEISATGHIYENYVSNEDATYLADGTETAKCNTCDLTDTRTAEGSKLEYTYTEMEATMYAQQTVNVRDLPSTDGNKVGSLNEAEEVTVLAQCNETQWYKILYNDSEVFVINSYLATEKPAEKPAQQPNEQVAQSSAKYSNAYGQSYSMTPAEARAAAEADGYNFDTVYTAEDGHQYMYYFACHIRDLDGGYWNIALTDTMKFPHTVERVAYYDGKSYSVNRLDAAN